MRRFAGGTAGDSWTPHLNLATAARKKQSAPPPPQRRKLLHVTSTATEQLAQGTSADANLGLSRLTGIRQSHKDFDRVS